MAGSFVVAKKNCYARRVLNKCHETTAVEEGMAASVKSYAYLQQSET
jgi:hypothetical protein